MRKNYEHLSHEGTQSQTKSTHPHKKGKHRGKWDGDAHVSCNAIQSKERFIDTHDGRKKTKKKKEKKNSMTFTCNREQACHNHEREEGSTHSSVLKPDKNPMKTLASQNGAWI